jgi:alpha,alpha-trehalase
VVSAATTPAAKQEADPLAAAGAALPADDMEVAKAALRQGKLGPNDTKLPEVYAEASEYYGGNEVWSRARTFSNVSVHLASL